MWLSAESKSSSTKSQESNSSSTKSQESELSSSSRRRLPPVSVVCLQSPSSASSRRRRLPPVGFEVRFAQVDPVVPNQINYMKDSKEDNHHPNNEASSCNDNSEDDWEAVADRAPDELLSSQCLPDVSKLALEDIKLHTPARRGRGTFSYQKHGLYSDQQSGGPIQDDPENQALLPSSEGPKQTRELKYGTRHALVLADFPPSMTTTSLENLLEKFNYHDVVVRWVNDRTVLAVFRTPSTALEACHSLKCPFTVRVLDENDVLLSSIPERDLEPPRQRPKTSARTAQRLIAHGMGLKSASTSFGRKELKEQEEARKERIVSRRNMKDDAWGE